MEVGIIPFDVAKEKRLELKKNKKIRKGLKRSKKYQEIEKILITVKSGIKKATEDISIKKVYVGRFSTNYDLNNEFYCTFPPKAYDPNPPIIPSKDYRDRLLEIHNILIEIGYEIEVRYDWDNEGNRYLTANIIFER